MSDHGSDTDRMVVDASALRGWDIYTGIFVVFLGLSAKAMGDHPTFSWVPSWAVFILWYILVGRRAVAKRETPWREIFCGGAALILAWATFTNPWLSPMQGVAIPLVWWLFLPSHWRSVIWTAVVCLCTTAGVAVYEASDPAHAWSTSKTIIYLAIFPLVIVAASVVLGRWADAFFRWGQDRMKLVDDLRQTEQRQIALEREAAVTEERRYLSQEVHDTIAQDIVGLRFLVERARRQAALTGDPVSNVSQPRPLDETLGMVAAAVDAVLTDTRALITTTMPPPSSSSFKEAVERIVGRFAKETGIEIDVDVADVRLRGDARVVFIRCLQEGLSNVRKHAQASRVWISIKVVGDVAMMTLTDNGVGMEAGASRGFGLPGMEQRVRMAGGSFVLESPGRRLGVTMRVRMPVRPYDGTGSDGVPAGALGESVEAGGVRS